MKLNLKMIDGSVIPVSVKAKKSQYIKALEIYSDIGNYVFKNEYYQDDSKLIGTEIHKIFKLYRKKHPKLYVPFTMFIHYLEVSPELLAYLSFKMLDSGKKYELTDLFEERRGEISG